jgi:uncharacterized protein (TIGR00369 family)
MTALDARIRASFDAQGLMATLGATLALVHDGEVHIALPFSAALTQQRGFVHAGAITSVVDSACGYAALTRAPPGHEVVTVEFKVNFMRPALGERFVAVGRVHSAGRTLAVCVGEVRAYPASVSATPASLTSPYKVVALMQTTMAYTAP